MLPCLLNTHSLSRITSLTFLFCGLKKWEVILFYSFLQFSGYVDSSPPFYVSVLKILVSFVPSHTQTTSSTSIVLHTTVLLNLSRLVRRTPALFQRSVSSRKPTFLFSVTCPHFCRMWPPLCR